MASFSRTLLKEDPANSNAMVKNSGRSLSLRFGDYSQSSRIALDEIGASGKYKNDSVPDGLYRLYVGDDLNSESWIQDFGTFWVGDENLPYMGLATPGEWGGQDKQLTSIADPTEGYHVGDVDFNDSRYILQTEFDDFVTVNTFQTISAQKGWQGHQSFTGGARFLLTSGGGNYPQAWYEDELLGQVYKAPLNPLDLVPKQYADSLVAGITVPAVPYSATEVVVIHGITQVVGKIYSSILNAANYLNTLSLSNSKRGVIYLRGNPNTNYYIAGTGSLQNYQNWVGYAPALINSTGDFSSWNNLGSIVIVCEGTATKKMTISNTTLIFGNSNAFVLGNQSGARTYSEFCFNNCMIIAYNNTSFNNCTLKDCIIIHSGSFKATLENCSIINCCFSNDPEVDDSNIPSLYASGFSWNIPNDITAHIPMGS